MGVMKRRGHFVVAKIGDGSWRETMYTQEAAGGDIGEWMGRWAAVGGKTRRPSPSPFFLGPGPTPRGGDVTGGGGVPTMQVGGWVGVGRHPSPPACHLHVIASNPSPLTDEKASQ